MLVVEVVHQGFGEIQDAHARVDWALKENFVPVHLNAGQVVAKDRCSCKQGTCDKLSQLVSRAAGQASRRCGFGGSPSSCRGRSCSLALKSSSRNRLWPSS